MNAIYAYLEWATHAVYAHWGWTGVFLTIIGLAVGAAVYFWKSDVGVAGRNITELADAALVRLNEGLADEVLRYTTLRCQEYTSSVERSPTDFLVAHHVELACILDSIKTAHELSQLPSILVQKGLPVFLHGTVASPGFSELLRRHDLNLGDAASFCHAYGRMYDVIVHLRDAAVCRHRWAGRCFALAALLLLPGLLLPAAAIVPLFASFAAFNALGALAAVTGLYCALTYNRAGRRLLGVSHRFDSEETVLKGLHWAILQEIGNET
jgi:hypothetical protein